MQDVTAVPSRSVVAAVFVLMCATAAAGFVWGTYAAGGADSYGYVSQAHAWLESGIPLREPLATRLKVRDAPWVCAPLGWRPGPKAGDLVPIYPPGLPLLMALAMLVAGSSAAFAVSPVLGAVAVGCTYRLARSIASPGTSLFAAALVATNATFLFQIVQPMSDVPVTGLWAACLVALRSRRVWTWGVAGALGGLAILVRPNLAPLALVAIAYGLATASEAGGGDSRHGGRDDRRARDQAPGIGDTGSRGMSVLLAAFVVPVAAALGVLGWLNAAWYGSPTLSGYGRTDVLFSPGHVGGNLVRYGTWIAETNPIALPLAAACALVLLRRHRRIGRPRTVAALALVCIAVLGLYLPYLEFEAWWYTRFLLVGFPPLMALVATVLAASARRWRVPRMVSLPIVAIILATSLVIAQQRGAFGVRRIEARYPEAAAAVQVLLPRNAVILAKQHSGSVRLYASRTTLRWDSLRPGDLDSLIRQLQRLGRPPFAVLDPDERTEFLDRFRHSRTVQEWRYGHLYLTRHAVELMALAP